MPLLGVKNKLTVNRLPLITSLCEEQAAEAAVSGSSARKAPEGKPWNKADNFCLIVRKHDEARGSHEVAEHFMQERGRL